jgi:IS605 OrfB family transposase
MAKRVKPKVRKETSEQVRTFQLRLRGEFADLDDLADRYQRAKRTTYGQAKLASESFVFFKEEICTEFCLPSRMFSGVDQDLAGMVKGIQEKAKFDASETEDRLAKTAAAQKKLTAKLEQKDLSESDRKKAKTGFHRKRESRDFHTAKLDRLKVRTEAKFPSICFGSGKLLNAQHHRDENGYDTHAEWLGDWQAKRADQFLVVGSNDEPNGNKTCRVQFDENGVAELDLFMGKGYGHLKLPAIMLRHGHGEWMEAVLAADVEYEVSELWQAETKRLSAEMVAKLPPETDEKTRAEHIRLFSKERRKLRKAQPKTGHGISYRFIKDKVGWRILVTVTRTVALLRPDFSRGSIGVDTNDQHISRTRVGPKGEFINTRDLPMVTYGKSTGQRLARLHEIAHILVMEALQAQVPLSIEKLDLSAKKRRLREIGYARAARRLSSFCYSKFAAVLKAHARLHGVCVVEVNPAYTSVIGAAIHAVPTGLTVHGAAAMVIARRAMSVEEEIPERMRVHVFGRAPRTMERPLSLRRKATVEPLWSGWAELASAVHAAQAEGKTVRMTGTQRRRQVLRDALDREACIIPF